MLKERVRACYQTEKGCSRVILQAAAEEYGIPLSKEILAACSGISGGFGIGGFCSGLTAAVMVLGLLFDAEEIGFRRILFLFKVQEWFGTLDCCRLSAMGEDCGTLLEEIGEILQEVIEQ